MRRCEHCNIEIQMPREHCPLCGAAAHIAQEGEMYAHETFPPIPTFYQQHGLLLRVLIFLSVTAGAGCVLINMSVSSDIAWSLIVLFGILYMWEALYYGARRLNRLCRVVITQMVVLSALCVVVDQVSGNFNWAINYALPSLCVSALFATAIIALVTHLELEDVGIYLIMNALLGIVPLIFVMLGFATVAWPSVACVFFSFISLVGVLVLGGKDMLQELRKRLHP